MLKKFVDNDGYEIKNNYLIICENWRKIFLSMDKEKLAERFHLKKDIDAYYIVYYKEIYRLDRETGMLTLAAAPDRILPFNTVMAIYNLFYYSKPDAKICGEFVPFRRVKRAAPFEAAFYKMIVKPFAKTFSGHCDLLQAACLRLDGVPIRQGDVGYIINAFECVPVTMVFWDGDDEFEAQANFLFDADITDFLHEETVCCIASDLVRRLSEEAGLGEVENLL